MKITKKIKYLQIHKTTQKKNQTISTRTQLNKYKKKLNYLRYQDKYQHKQQRNS